MSTIPPATLREGRLAKDVGCRANICALSRTTAHGSRGALLHDDWRKRLACGYATIAIFNMAVGRDDFNRDTKGVLARRVGYRCSNPNCRKLTCGPQETPTKSVNIGVAAHLAAAAPGGPRYDLQMNPQERGEIENGIWLCQNCAKLIDNDEARYTVDLLRRWRRISEEAARLEVETGSGPPQQDDLELIRFYCQCFDRPAFQDPFRQEGSMEAFDRAIEDTITALNTGCLRSRDGGVLQQSKGKALVSNPEWRNTLDTIVDVLRAIRSRYDLAVKTGQIHVSPSGDFYCIHDPSVAEWMDETRGQIIEMLNRLCEEAHVGPLRFPRFRSRHW